MIQLIGGEMPDYAEQLPPAGGPLLRHLVEHLPTGARVLLAGPHDPGLVAALAPGRELTCLVRSHPDALAQDARDVPGVRILCGTLPKLTETDRYDAVLALDGVARLCSPEGPQLDWLDAVRALKRVLRPGGALLLTVENELGVHRLVDPGAATAARTEDAWRPLGEFGTAPGRADRVAAALDAEGLVVSGLAAAWPAAHHPTLLVTPETLGHGPVHALAALVTAAVGTAYANRPVLCDPRRLAGAAVRRGLGAELAPAWLAVAHRAPIAAPAVTLPPVLRAGPGTITELTGSPEAGWAQRTVGHPGDRPLPSERPLPTAQPRPAERPLTAERPHIAERSLPAERPLTAERPLPAGRLLEELLLTAALRHELPTLRRLLTGWMVALPTADAGNVLVDGDRFALLDPDAPDCPDALTRFARTLTTGGYAHPWQAIADLPRLTAILAGAAGLDELPEQSEAQALPDGRREHEEQLSALRRRLADAEARAGFFEHELEKRDAELGRARMQIAAFSGGLGYRAAKAGLAMARKARNRLRQQTTRR
ncbi:hypothetical protein GCM10010168_68160 [Actinoplanes ianthinogenes]|uniref:Class I SAM-dependent methyltransferase n=1 Tax=Actinoplanes ianthinogenes TaxID=122358 RepID=A0ABM7LXF0_9ACTN|nr:hypothetical protein [Actinoplanes ianthinogenes]BCJ44013.1 hypothetical protein Aiant_46700 [Actinoplanes ianthinogenes]GGR39770.1 hypothetical protein GCM10010168_68160 [Actinoplanes ianthinogenes]